MSSASVDGFRGLGPFDATAFQPEGDVAGDGHVRKQGVGLEHHADVAAPDRDGGDILFTDGDLAFVGGHETRDDAQQGGFAGTGRPQ